MAPTPLRIKINALNRLVKEEGLYLQEAQEQEIRIQALREAGADEYEIKKQIEVLEDTKKMVPEIRKKIQSTLEGLKAAGESDNEEDNVAAKETIKKVEEFLA
ncbi:uncharacterized protein SAPINGB_P000361 [Magnusiomyces paraingens]|uniref:Tubulin-specific chaperone A n=1 Tax=Magnusiomyces paraingens TaxID=2606893 RepID=A0A5E8B3R5_9ASCO|nr:uncharacterized protein SAPINGB_P000361 [Saprochaete ingens]VVT44273.1 unnamed protein product [Saprochaete ingens]